MNLFIYFLMNGFAYNIIYFFALFTYRVHV